MEDTIMSRYFTCHWQNRLWAPNINWNNRPIRSAGSTQFGPRGVLGGRGHAVYIISLNDGQLYLGGRMSVSRIVSRDEAVRVRGTDDLYDVDEWVIDETPEGGSRLHLTRRLAPELTHRLCWIMASGDEQGLCFVSQTHLSPQATRGVHELTEGSAHLLDEIISLTDRMPRTGELITVTEALLRRLRQGSH